MRTLMEQRPGLESRTGLTAVALQGFIGSRWWDGQRVGTGARLRESTKRAQSDRHKTHTVAELTGRAGSRLPGWQSLVLLRHLWAQNQTVKTAAALLRWRHFSGTT